MVALASRKDLSALDNFQHFWRKPRFGIVRYSYNDEPLHIIRLIRLIRVRFISRDQASVVQHRRK